MSKDEDFVEQLIVANTSSDSKTLLAIERFWLIAPIKKLLIDIDLSGSTNIILLKGEIFFFIFRSNLL